MSYIEDIKPKADTWQETAFVWFLRLLAICFIGFTVQYWLRVTGYYPGPDWRFDTMSSSWKIASAMLAVLLPVSAVGLWSALSWGQVVWTMAVITELIMYSWLPEQFGRNPNVLIFHLVTIVIFLIFRGYFIYNDKKA